MKKNRPTLRDALVFIQSLELRDLEALRNSVEIDIYHAQQRLAFLAKYAWFVCVISALVGLLDRDVVALILAPVVAGLAYSIRSLKSRRFAIMLAVSGALIALDVPYRLLTPNKPHDLMLAFAVSVVFLGVAAAETVIRLTNLQAFRTLIPLGPAKHLRD
jgi:hypothetical protein